MEREVEEMEWIQRKPLTKQKVSDLLIYMEGANQK